MFKFGRREGYKKDKNDDEFRDRVYAFSEGLANWAKNEVMLFMRENKEFDQLDLNPSIAEYRAQKMAEESGKLKKEQKKKTVIIRSVLRALGNALKDRSETGLSFGEQQRLDILCASGMDRIRFSN